MKLFMGTVLIRSGLLVVGFGQSIATAFLIIGEAIITPLVLIEKWVRALLKYSGTILALLAGVTSVAILGTIGSIAGLIIFIGCFFVLGDKRQAIHDLVAKTAVFKK